MADQVTADRPLTLEEKKELARARARAARAQQDAGIAQIAVSDAAAAYVRKSADETGRPHGVRLRILAGGCSGLEYKLDLLETDEAIRDDERVVETNGIKLVLDTKSSIHVTGSTIDYEESILQRGFTIKNPNATSTCSCGTSFGV